MDRGEIDKIAYTQRRYEEDHYNRYHHRRDDYNERDYDDDDDDKDYYRRSYDPGRRGRVFLEDLFNFDLI